MMNGIPASPGVGLGRALVLKQEDLQFTPHTVGDREAELSRYRAAVEAFSAASKKKSEAVRASAGDHEAEILLGHILMIEDPYMNGEIEKDIRENGQCAEQALSAVCEQFIAIFSAADDELTRQRAADVRDVRDGVLRGLLGVEETDLSEVPAGTVLVARELTPSMTAGIKRDAVVGIVTESGGKTSHSAILARALRIPAVLSVEHAMTELKTGDEVILDGSEGLVLPRPGGGEKADYEKKRAAYADTQKALLEFFQKPTVTADGAHVELVCNIGHPEETEQVLEASGEGVGLFRTEFLFLDRAGAPSEEEQFKAYQKAVLSLKGKPVILRTLDIGGDKEVPYLGLQRDENPFLGFRAIRLCLSRPDLFVPQLRALLRASAFGDLRIMLPLITSMEEVRAAKDLLEEQKAALKAEGIAFNENIPVGVMMETSAASLIADLLAKETDFFSIGTNDLTQYTMCADRGNPKVAALCSPYQPAVLRSLERIIGAAKAGGIPVGMCGEAAADPLLIPLLIAFGLDEYSVSPSSVLAARRVLSLWSREEASALCKEAMALETADEVEALLKARQK